MSPPSVSLVMPTYRRAAALEANVPTLLAVDGVDEIVVVPDGPDPETAAVLASFDDPRLRVVTLPEHGGSQVARNAGIAAARGDWLLMADDDCRLPPDYVTTMLAESERHGADIVGAPWVLLGDGDLDAAVAEARTTLSVSSVGLATPVNRFPDAAVETPFLYSQVLVRRAVFEAVSYDTTYKLNSWREETSLFLDATRAGFKCVLTPLTYSYQVGDWDGGQRSGALRREFWILVNNWRFLRRHGDWLRDHGEIRGVLREQSAFGARRYRQLLRERREVRAVRARRAHEATQAELGTV
jgi:GT2 family glycosyltransferase